MSRRQVEALYPRVLFQDSTSSDTSCTFQRFGDEVGSVTLEVQKGGPSAYTAAVGNLSAGKAVTGVGDQAVYSEGDTTLVARSGDRVLILANHSVSGFDTGKDAASQNAARQKASIALAKLVLAS